MDPKKRNREENWGKIFAHVKSGRCSKKEIQNSLKRNFLSRPMKSCRISHVCKLDWRMCWGVFWFFFEWTIKTEIFFSSVLLFEPGTQPQKCSLFYFAVSFIPLPGDANLGAPLNLTTKKARIQNFYCIMKITDKRHSQVCHNFK